MTNDNYWNPAYQAAARPFTVEFQQFPPTHPATEQWYSQQQEVNPAPEYFYAPYNPLTMTPIMMIEERERQEVNWAEEGF